MRKIKGRKKSGSGRTYVTLMVLFLVTVMGTQLVTLCVKSYQYSQREAQLEQELAAQEERRQELLDYEQYTQTEEYMRNTAKNKLGLVSPDEIIFREQ